MDTPEEFESKDRDFKAPDDADQPSESMPEWLKAETKQEFERALNEAVESFQDKMNRLSLKRHSIITNIDAAVEGMARPKEEFLEHNRKIQEEIDNDVQEVSREIRRTIEKDYRFNATLMPEDLKDLVGTMKALQPLIEARVRKEME